jgi:hypothetical protein
MNQWTPLIPVVLLGVSYALRRYSPKDGWLHSALGAFVIASVSGLLATVAQAIQAHGLSSAAIMPAVASFLGSLFATANPTMGAAKTEESTTLKAPPGASARALLPFAFLALASMAGCAHNALDGVRQSLIASSQMVKASADTFAAGDLAYQRLLEKRPDAAAAIAKYRTDTQPKILKAFVDAAATLSLGLVTVGAVDAGTKSKNDLGAIMSQVFQELQALQELLATVAAPPPPLPPVSWGDHAAPCEDEKHCREVVLPSIQLPEVEVAHAAV